jgi:hypothetical protein
VGTLTGAASCCGGNWATGPGGGSGAGGEETTKKKPQGRERETRVLLTGLVTRLERASRKQGRPVWNFRKRDGRFQSVWGPSGARVRVWCAAVCERRRERRAGTRKRKDFPVNSASPHPPSGPSPWRQTWSDGRTEPPRRRARR